MKKYFGIIIIIVSLTFSYMSCDSYLDTESKSSFVEETVFSNIDFARKAVLGVYAKMVDNALWGQALGYFLAYDNDLEFCTGADDGARRNCARYTASDGNSFIQNPWINLYGAIEQANICIDNLKEGTALWNNELNGAETKQLYGEAKTLRALFYFELIKYWGDVPWCGESFKDGIPFYKHKTDKDSIYEVLIADLEEVQQYVPWQKNLQTSERIGKGFVKGLRARMALSYAGYSLRNKTLDTRKGRNSKWGYEVAREECEDLMLNGPHRLNPSYEGFFRMLHEYKMDITYGESLFEIAYGRGTNSNLGNWIGMAIYNGPGDPKYGRTAVEIGTTPYLFYSYDTKDLRRNVNVELGNMNSRDYPGQMRPASTAGTAFRHCKWRKRWIVPAMGGDERDVSGTGINYPLMRYTDVVLMFAEAENELNGPTDAAKEALASVRRRAFKEEDHSEKVTAYIESVSGSKQAFLDALIDERAWEFCGEMIRKQDLVRWNRLGERIAHAKAESWKIMRNDPEYQWVPNYLFWKYAADGETMDVLNPDYRMPSSPTPSGYTRTTWLGASSDANKTDFKNFIDLVGKGYDPVKNNHLLPIHMSIIDNSRGYLTNDQMPQAN